jgi:hypothetical protein
MNSACTALQKALPTERVCLIQKSRSENPIHRNKGIVPMERIPKSRELD